MCAADGAQEASGYAATLADLTGEAVLLVPFFDNTPQELQRARFTGDGVLEVRTGACLADPPRVSGADHRCRHTRQHPRNRAQRCSSEASRCASAAPGTWGPSQPTANFCGCALGTRLAQLHGRSAQQGARGLSRKTGLTNMRVGPCRAGAAEAALEAAGRPAPLAVGHAWPHRAPGRRCS